MPNLVKSGGRILMAGSSIFGLEPSVTTTLLQQPSNVARIVGSSVSGNFFVHGATGAGAGNPPLGTFGLVSEQSNPLTGNGLFQANAWNAGALTGFTPNTPATAQLSYAASNQSTTAQWEGNTIGVYMQTIDRPNDPPAPAKDKMMITPAVNFLPNTAVFTGPSSVLTCSLLLQVPTAVGTGNPAGAAPFLNVNQALLGPTSAQFPTGFLFSVNVAIFHNGATTPGGVTTSLDTPTNTHLLVVPLGPGVVGGSNYVTTNSGVFTNAPWLTGFRFFSFSISYAQFAAALTFYDAQSGGGIVPSFDPTQYFASNMHLNAELHFNPPSAYTMGWSVQNWLTTVTS